ncbi:MAG: S8 family serine peptidase [Holophagales bacterium]|nr:S8 family serine peptidase [Holophagales bacterium]
MFGAIRGKRRLVPAVALIAVGFLLTDRGEAGSIGRGAMLSGAGSETAVTDDGTSLSDATGAPAGRVRVMVELVEPAAAVAYGNALKANAGLPRAQARSAAAAAGRAQTAVVRSAQSRFDTDLARLSVRPTDLFRVQKSLNGVALEVNLSQMAELRALPGVKRVIPLYLEHPTNSTSVPFIGTPQVWANTIGLPAGADGSGIRIGIIDSGTDYLHPAFGGPGAAAADYVTERTDTAAFTTAGTALGGSFPTAKVVGGWDFAGDAYTGGAAPPVPDPNPMDCGGHGSHVSGTAAAYGMNADGSTFTGPYDANPSTYSSLLIGPGAAPMADIYALRVFGCSGSTGLTTLAIDWAMDPNGDLDFSDHLDVINMSLGSSFGSAVNATAVSSDNAALAGVIVVASAGNAGDTFFISGAPVPARVSSRRPRPWMAE